MFSTDDIRRAVDAGTLRHGREDLARRLVISVLRKPGGHGAYAAVRDPGGRPYKSELAWQPRAGGGWSFSSHCSCRSGKLCRHAVAALLWLLQHEVVEDADHAKPASPAASPAAVTPAPGSGPRPGLRLLRLEPESGPRGERVLDFAQLWFDYGGLRCSYDERAAPRLRGEGESPRREVPRDRAAERRAREQLQAIGLIPSDPARPSLLLPRSERDWLSLMAGPIPALQDAGWTIEIDPDFSFRLYEAAPDFLARLDDAPGGDWFGLALDIEVEGKRQPLLPLLIAALRQQLFTPQRFDALDDATPIILHDEARDRWIRIAAGRLKPIVATLLEVFETPKLGAHGELWLPRGAAGLLADLADRTPQLQFSGAEELRATAARLRDFRGLKTVPPPPGLQAELRPYQQEGLNWLQFLREQGFGGVLADDMGLGKTLQTLAHLRVEQVSGRLDRPCLVVAPTSLMFNWQREAQRFTPSLRVLVLQGPDRHLRYGAIGDHDVVLTTYPLLARDFEVLGRHEYHLLILDEAQNIKNARSRAAQLVSKLRARHRLCLSGTPMENHLGEFWSIMHFLMPGFFGSEIDFKRRYRVPIEKHADPHARERLLRRARPFLLRRTKAEVAKELPPRTDILRSVALEDTQRELYESLRLAMDRRVRAEIAAKGLARSHLTVLDALLKLRQVCCDPRLIAPDTATQPSAKLEMLMELLPQMIEEGRKVLLFSQFTSMLALIEERVRAAGIDYVLLTGETRDRQAVVERFQRGEVPLFLISLKAGGVGLNLTAADSVIHYDPWWNPAVEQQATDRAHRIGQDKPVFVYKLLTEGTVEQKIAELQEKKRGLADALLSDAGSAAALTAEDLQGLFAA